MAEDTRDDSPSSDVVLFTGRTEDGEGLRVLRARDERVEAGEVRPLKEGKPLAAGEVVRLSPRAGTPGVCDVEVLAKVASAASTARAAGPPQVATSAYRESWDRIFGPSTEPSALN